MNNNVGKIVGLQYVHYVREQERRQHRSREAGSLFPVTLTMSR